MAITKQDNTIVVDGEDHNLLYEIYCEGDSEGVDQFEFVAKQYTGKWRWGSNYLFVVRVAGHDGLCGVSTQDQEGDEPYRSLDPKNCMCTVELLPVDEVKAISYQIRKGQ